MNFKFSVIKKNQILASMVVLMLVVAGYLNYTYDPSKEYNEELFTSVGNNLGDTYLVDSSSINTNIDDMAESIEASGKVLTAEEYFASTRMERENLFAQQKETYEKILSNSSIDDSQKEFAMQEIAKVNNQKNAISIIENLLKLKGYKDAVVLISEDSVNVIVISEILSDIQKNDIVQIVQSELNVEEGKIHIRNL